MSKEFSLSPESAVELNRAVQKLADAAGTVARDVIVPQARLFCVDLAMNTKRKGKTAKAAADHKKDIIGRLDTIYITAGAAVNMIKRRNQGAAIAFQRAVRKQDFQEASKIINKYFRSDWRVGMFDGGKLHMEQRFARRVTKRMVVADKASLTRYKQETVKKVGFAKGGFAAAARQLGGVRGIPGFATRQNAPGSARVSESGGKLTVTITNNVRYIGDALDRAGEASAISYRSRAVTAVIKRMADRRFKSSSKAIQ